jgi:hypothetical protein
MKVPEILLIETDHRPASLARVLEVVDAAGLTIEIGRCTRRSPSRAGTRRAGAPETALERREG